MTNPLAPVVIFSTPGFPSLSSVGENIVVPIKHDAPLLSKNRVTPKCLLVCLPVSAALRTCFEKQNLSAKAQSSQEAGRKSMDDRPALGQEIVAARVSRFVLTGVLGGMAVLSPFRE